MSNNEHRAGVNEINLVHRSLKLRPGSVTRISELIAEVDSLLGVDSVFYDSANNILLLAYDASKVDLGSIEAKFKEFDIEIKDDWWTHLKEDYYKFVDKNIKDNASHQPWSCHRTPPAHSNKRK